MQGFQRYLGVSLLVSHISCAVACAAVGVTGVESPGTVRINVKGATVTLNRKSLAGFVYVTDGHINLNGDVSQTLVVTNGSVQIGENVTVGAAFLSGGRVDALRGVAITNMAYINGTTFMLRGGPCFSMSGSHLSDPEHGSKRNISVSAGTLSLSVGHGVVIGTSGSGTSAFDSETGLWSLTETGVGGFDGDGAYMRYITIPPMDFDFTLRAVSNPQVWNKACVMVRDGLVQSGASGVHRANLYFGNIHRSSYYP